MMSTEFNPEMKNENPEKDLLLGPYLKDRRLKKNYSLEKLSQKTKISVNILKHLENNEFDSLPSAAYIKGFVTSYVKVLGLPIDEAINKMEYTYLNIVGKPFPALNHTKLLQPQSHIPQKTEEHQDPHQVIEKVDSIFENTKSALPFVIFILVILSFIGGYQVISKIVNEEIGENKEKTSGPKIVPSSALITKAQEIKALAETPKNEKEGEILKELVATTPPEETIKPFERNFPTVEFKKITGTLFNLLRDANENSDPTIISEEIKNAMNPELQNIYIKAVSGNTWLSYKVDEKPIRSVIINQNSDLFIQGNEIRIFLGNVNVTKIFYNNTLIDTPTKSGVKSLIFPVESNKKFLMPLFSKAKDDILYTAEDYQKRMKVEEEEMAKRQ